MVSSTDIIAGPYTLNGVTVAFAFTYRLPGDDTSLVQVIITRQDAGHEDEEVELTETTHYAVSATNQDFSDGGTVTITNTIRDLYTEGYITLILNVSFLQESDYQNSDDLPKEVIEADFDKAVYRDLRLLETYNRTLHVPLTDDSAEQVIPSKTTRASKYLGFDAQGSPVAVAGSDGGDALSLDGASKSTDGTLAANSNAKIPTEAAVKTYIDGASVLHTAGAETAAGVKTFSDGIDAGGGGTALKFKVIEIGDWDMDATATVTVAHGLTADDIRHVEGSIRPDVASGARTNTLPISNLVTAGTGGTEIDACVAGWDATDIHLARRSGGGLDTSAFDATSYNRGWLVIWYEG